jgi:hypothetical protein
MSMVLVRFEIQIGVSLVSVCAESIRAAGLLFRFTVLPLRGLRRHHNMLLLTGYLLQAEKPGKLALSD